MLELPDRLILDITRETFLDMLLIMCDYSVSKIELFKYFFLCEIFQNFEKGVQQSDLLTKKMSNYHISAKYC